MYTYAQIFVNTFIYIYTCIICIYVQLCTWIYVSWLLAEARKRVNTLLGDSAVRPKTCVLCDTCTLCMSHGWDGIRCLCALRSIDIVGSAAGPCVCETSGFSAPLAPRQARSGTCRDCFWQPLNGTKRLHLEAGHRVAKQT